MKKSLLSIIFALFSVIAVFGQYTASQYVKAATKAIGENKYYSALVNYSKAIEMGETNPEIKYLYGVSAEKSGAFGIAESALEDYVNNDSGVDQGAAMFKLAGIKQMLGKYDDAEKYYDLYLAEYGDAEGAMKGVAKLGKKSSNWASEQPLEVSGVNIEHLKREVNSDYADVSPVLLDDELYYSTLRFSSNEKEVNYAQIVTKSDGPLSTSANFNLKEKDYLTVSPSFSNDGSMMVYALCKLTYDEVQQDCKLYYTTKSGGGYGGGTALPASINVEGSSSTNPSLVDHGDGSYTLYFASTMPGGKGNYDIWSSSFNTEMDFSAPKNVGKVNTAGVDFTPFYHSASNTLYFSSNSRSGFGGFDLYKSSGDGSGFGAVENLGAPFNSSNHDRYYWLNEAGDEAYLVSNRPGSYYYDESFETCCHDIYKLTIDLECEMLVNVTDCNTGSKLGDSNITIKDLTTGEEIYSGPSNGSYKTMINRNHEYEVTATNDCYNSNSEKIGPVVADGDDCMQTMDLCLEGEKIDLTACTFDRKTNRELTRSEICIVDNKTGEQQCKKTDANHCATFATIAGKSYSLTGKNAGYLDGAASYVSNCNENKVNIYLGKPEPNCLQSLVPMRLYFDNDEPNPRSKSVTSTESYDEACAKYRAKQEEYKRRHCSNLGMKSGQREICEAEIISFFNNELGNGCGNLNLLLPCLLESLQAGDRIELFIRGFASPIASSEYNDALAKRRIDSVRKSIQRYNGGVLMQYINSGQLKLTERPLGESTASGVSDSANNRSQSVYSPEAMRERRVEIEQIKIN